MESLNAVSLVGWLELDLSTRWQGEASQCTTFTVRLEEQGTDKVYRVYVPVVCWGKTAERAAELTPGDVIGVQGKLVYRRAQDRPAEPPRPAGGHGQQRGLPGASPSGGDLTLGNPVSPNQPTIRLTPVKWQMLSVVLSSQNPP